MPGSQPSSTPRRPSRLALSHTTSIPVNDLVSDTYNGSPPSSPISLTSSPRELLSPISNLIAELEQTQEAPPAPSLPSPPRVSVEIAPLSQSCRRCGASIVTPHHSTAALYSLSITIPSAINGSIQVRVATQTPREAAKATSTPDPAVGESSGQGKKRKAPADDDIDEIAFSSLAPPAKTAKKQGGAVSSAAKTSQATGPTKKVTFTPMPITSKTATSVSSFADDLLQFSEDDETDGRKEFIPPVSYTTFPKPTTSQERPGRSTHSSSSLQEESTAGVRDAATLDELQEEKRRLLKYKALWEREQAVMQAQNNDSPEDDELIPRPPGEKGKNGWNMQEALRLKDNGDMYNNILATTRTAVLEAGLDWTINFRAQDLGKLTDCYARMKLRHSYLTQFERDWACRELVKSALQNRRKTDSMRQRGALAPKSSNPIKASKRGGFNPRPKTALEQPEGS